ncbi:(2,3-dihydroxybenzoyl)adenylate synthase [Corynebacterium aquilae]|uniref:Long-chain-fatty-acid--CoA ligase n=1 Tax=Corynebacterium aquilae DSM 44791 TaxID=1431546 RepID=A0A1L7CF43_9CORY|nr:AMP-binding protein [Corynebacterium aquilae]APT84448.1 hypothetical protein CAQU_04500 [Corynebacterium aquilae DSM 44791]
MSDSLSAAVPCADEPLVTADELYPAEVRRRYVEAGVWTSDTFASLLEDSVRAWGGREAVVGPVAACPGQPPARLSYAQLDAYANAVAHQLANVGVGVGHRVVLFCPNTVEYVGAFFGVVRLGAVPVHALPAHGVVELSHFLQASGASAVVTVERFGLTRHGEVAAEAVRVAGTGAAVVVACAPGEGGDLPVLEPAVVNPFGLGLIQLSGGTTGVPKLIARSHADYLFSVRRSVEVCEVSAETKMLVVLPAAHNFTMSSPGILGVLSAGGTVVFAPDPTPGSAFALIESEGVTMASLVPPLAMLWLQAAESSVRDLSSLRVLQVGGARFADSAAARVGSVLGCKLQQVFGMAEGLVNYTRLDDPEELVTTTQGYPMSELDEVLVLDDDGHPVADGCAGLLWTRGPYTIRGYIGGVSASSFDDQGFYCTGDVVRRLPSGHLVVEGRAKEQINRAGEKISCEEVENLILGVDGVADCLVLGVSDEHLGERICAVIIPQDPALCDDERFSCQRIRQVLSAGGVAAFKLPDEVVVRPSFPTTNVGKASRAATRKLLSSQRVG